MPLRTASSGQPPTRLTTAAEALTRTAPDLRTPEAADAVVDLVAAAHRVLVEAAEAADSPGRDRDARVSVLDLRGPAAGDPSALAALAGDLRSAAAVLLEVVPTRDGAARALLLAADALNEAASALRDLPRPAPAGCVEDVEAHLARRLRENAGTLARETSEHETERTQVV